MSGRSFFEIKLGALVSHDGKVYRVKRLLGWEKVLVEDLDTPVATLFDIETLEPPPQSLSKNDLARPAPDLESISEAEWAVAQRRYAVILPLVGLPGRTRAQVVEIAAKAEVNTATIYEWLKLFENNGYASALIPRRPGHARGTKLIEQELEAIVDANIKKYYLNKLNGQPSEVIRQIGADCYKAKIKPPHENTIRNRLRDLPAPMVLRAQGRHDEADARFVAKPGTTPGGDFPLSMIKIDHTLADCEVVDEESRRSIGTPTATVAIDLCTRMIFGVYLSLDKPNMFSVGSCLTMGMLPKGEYLRSLGLPGEWPLWGKPTTVQADNAREFTGKVLKKALSQHGIGSDFRPVAKPRYGAHIERWMGTGNNLWHNIPGTKKSNIKQKGKYDSGKEAIFTLKEAEKLFIDYIVNEYHNDFHAGIGMSPLEKFKKMIVGDDETPGIGLPEKPANPTRLRRDFLPFFDRIVQPDGVVIDKVKYWKETLTRWIGATDPITGKKQKLIFRRDPNLISPIWAWDPEIEEYLEIPYADPIRPPTNIWEVRAANAELLAAGKAEKAVREPQIFESILRRRESILVATAKTAAARRKKAKIKDTEERAATAANTPAPAKAPRKIDDPWGAAADSASAEFFDDLVPAPVRRTE